MGTLLSKSPLQKEIETNIKTYPVLIYTQNGCIYCIKAETLFKNMQINPHIINISTHENPTELKSALYRLTSQKTVPLIWVNSSFIGGFTELLSSLKSNTLQSLLQQAQIDFQDPFNEMDQMHHFQIPTKQIANEAMLASFKASAIRNDILGFICSLEESVKSKKRSDTEMTENCRPIVNLLERLYNLVDEHPPIDEPERYGNKAFTDFQQHIEREGPEIVSEILRSKANGESLIENEAHLELSKYLEQAFGDFLRIDYGTGHELNFLCFLLCLFGIGYLGAEDESSIVHHVFWKYMEVMRKVEETYKLEPAGSHGVWGLDDYHFLPFLFGGSELVDHPEYEPGSIHDERVVRDEENEYLYFHCIAYIKECKSGHFGEHSPMLNDISGVVSWAKVAEGMVKMYENEVLNKLPVMKHFMFGSIILNREFNMSLDGFFVKKGVNFC